MKGFRKVEIMLSVACAISSTLGICISQASTDVVWVQPQGNTSGEFTSDMGYVAESFIATADTITTASFFCGKERPTGYYYGYINTSPNPGGTSAYGPSSGKKYQDVVFNFNVGVTRGQRYYFVVQHTGGGSPQGLEYYYREGTAYSWGSLYLSGTQDNAKDLCARVVGVNRIPQTFWGVDVYLQNSPWIKPQAQRDSIIDTLAHAGMVFDREQVAWFHIQDDSGPQCSTAYHWAYLDSAVYACGQRNIPILFDHFGFTPKWASSWDSAYSIYRWRGAPPKYLDATDTSQNYFFKLMRRLVQRYGPTGSFWLPDSMGHPIRDSFPNYAIRDWEIGNEVNLGNLDSCEYWGWWNASHYYGGYGHNHKDRARLYWLACKVAWEAIKPVDPTARIYTNAVDFINSSDPSGYYVSGKQWLRDFYDEALAHGNNYTDVITYHSYQPDSLPINHKFSPVKFQIDYDTLRAVLASKQDTYRPIWDDEVGWATGDIPVRPDNVKPEKQADIAVQLYSTGIGQLTNPRGPLDNISWFAAFDWGDTASKKFPPMSGILNFPPDSGVSCKKSYWAFKQMTGKLKDKYFNRRLAFPDTNVYAFEFQQPGPDTSKKTWVVWKTSGDSIRESLSVRTAHAEYIKIAYSSSPDSGERLPEASGFIIIWADTFPKYFKERNSDSLSRPDVVVDSLWTIPSVPKPGDGVFFYARIKNIGNAALSGTVPDTVTFQVDGSTVTRYGASRGLGTDTLTDTLTICHTAPYFDWTANYGDHLIRAWVDSVDRYVELREDNNQGYLFKHIQPKVSVVINNDHKYTNHLNNDTLHVVMNESTSPLPDSAKLKHESGSWIRLGVYGSRDTIVSYSGNGVAYDSVKVFQGSDVATGWDSIIVDASAPYAHITSPTPNQTVSGNVPFVGWSYDYEDHDSLWEIYVNSFAWASGNSKVGENPLFGLPGQFGTWNSHSVQNGWWWHRLFSTDAATNLAKDSVRVRVRNNQTNGGDSWAADFGTFTSPVMNVATDPGGNVYFAETQNSKVRKYSPHKDSLFAFSAKRGKDSTGTNWATAMVLKDSTTLWIADGYAHCLKAFDRQGNLLLRFGSFGTQPGQFRQPCGIALDSKGRLWVSDRLNNRIQVFDSTGQFLFKFGSQGTDSGRFNSPTGIAITRKDTLLGITQDLVWVSDTRNNRIQVFDSLGAWVKTISQPDSLGFDTPLGICSDRYGDIFIADSRHDRMVELNPFGERILDFGGQGDSLWQFRTPVGLASSPGAHYLYVADMGNKRVTRFTVIEEDSSGGGPQTQGPPVKVTPKVNFLAQSHPNPASGEAIIEYGLAKESPVTLTIYNVAGQVVREYNPGKQEAGYYSIQWDGRSNLGHKVGAGVYFYRLQAGYWVKTRKMVVVR